MKQKLILMFILGVLCFSANAQKISKPTKTSVPPTPAQEKILLEGIKLHDSNKFDEAIATYLGLLDENPDYTTAIYELGLSYYAKKDYKKTLETAYRLVQYKGKDGVLGYGLFANALDDQGKPEDAIKIYQSAIKQLKDDPEFQEHLASLYYNIGVTYVRQKKYNEARQELKKAVENNFQYASPSYLLSEVYFASKYKIPAFLAASRLLSLEINSTRSARATAIIMDILKPAQKDEKGNIQIFMDLNAPKDEGDFGMFDLFLGTLTTLDKDEDKNKTENEKFADSVSTLIALLEENKDLKKTFVGKTYIPFMKEMKQKGYVKYFAYLLLQQKGNKDAEKWLVDEGQKTIDFLNWAKAYKLK